MSESEDDEKMLEPVFWVPKSEVKECNLCANKFSISRWKHHCRVCGSVVCGSCSESKVPLEGAETKIRMCLSCLNK